MPDPRPPDLLRRSLLGAWVADRRRDDTARFARITLHHDGRFTTLALDLRTLVYGTWWIEPSPVREHPAPWRVHLRFDAARGPDVVYALGQRGALAGAIELLPLHDLARPLTLSRALPLTALLTGRWSVGRRTSREPYALSHLVLGVDGTFAARLGGGVVRRGRWGCAMSAWSVPEVLVLDPDDAVLPLEMHAIRLRGESLGLDDPAAGHEVILERESLVVQARPLVGHWRRIDHPRGPGEELTLFADGACTWLDRPGSPAFRGTWRFARDPVRAGALAGSLTVSLDRRVLPLTRERWALELPTSRNATLTLHGAHDPTPRTYRKLFR